MSQQEFDNFKQRIKDWMDSHPEEYDCFEEEMNRKDNEGCQNILTIAFSLVPKYQKVLRKRMNQGAYNDISDIETLFWIAN
jgi:oligoendopeptidase F